MSHAVILILIGLVVAGVGGLIFFGGTKLIERQSKTAGGIASCLVALFGAVIIFAGFAIVVSALFVS